MHANTAMSCADFLQPGADSDSHGSVGGFVTRLRRAKLNLWEVGGQFWASERAEGGNGIACKQLRLFISAGWKVATVACFVLCHFYTQCVVHQPETLTTHDLRFTLNSAAERRATRGTVGAAANLHIL